MRQALAGVSFENVLRLYMQNNRGYIQEYSCSQSPEEVIRNAFGGKDTAAGPLPPIYHLSRDGIRQCARGSGITATLVREILIRVIIRCMMSLYSG
jgi:hypothetical protein